MFRGHQLQSDLDMSSEPQGTQRKSAADSKKKQQKPGIPLASAALGLVLWM